MDQQLSVPVWAALAGLVVLAVLAAVLATALVRTRTRSAAALVAARAETSALVARVEAIERRLAAPAEPSARADDCLTGPDYVVTMLGREDEDPGLPAPVVPAPLFADLVLREGVVQAASLAAGVRRALAPEVRHRIRFEMRREVKRARKQRRADERQARRDLQDRRAAA